MTNNLSPLNTSAPRKARAARTSMHGIAAELVTAELFPSLFLKPPITLMKRFIFQNK